MGIIGAYMVPHPPIIIPQIGLDEESRIADTIHAYQKVADLVAEQKPDTIVISTPHSVMYLYELICRVFQKFEAARSG